MIVDLLIVGFIVYKVYRRWDKKVATICGIIGVLLILGNTSNVIAGKWCPQSEDSIATSQYENQLNSEDGLDDNAWLYMYFHDGAPFLGGKVKVSFSSNPAYTYTAKWHREYLIFGDYIIEYPKECDIRDYLPKRIKYVEASVDEDGSTYELECRVDDDPIFRLHNRNFYTDHGITQAEYNDMGYEGVTDYYTDSDDISYRLERL